MTSKPFSNSKPVKWLPMNPAHPVTKTLVILQNTVNPAGTLPSQR
jgi:hypothetical protein